MDARPLLTLIGALAMAAPAAAQNARLGPRDGTALGGTDLARVAVGDTAPDFTLESLGGPPVTLSQFRGRANVILVFYRGHW